MLARRNSEGDGSFLPASRPGSSASGTKARVQPEFSGTFGQPTGATSESRARLGFCCNKSSRERRIVCQNQSLLNQTTISSCSASARPSWSSCSTRASLPPGIPRRGTRSGSGAIPDVGRSGGRSITEHFAPVEPFAGDSGEPDALENHITAVQVQHGCALSSRSACYRPACPGLAGPEGIPGGRPDFCKVASCLKCWPICRVHRILLMSTEPIPQDLVAVHDLLRETLAASKDSGSGLGYGIAIFPRTGRFGAPVFGIATSGGESTVARA